jgi:hypothetical protein
MYRIGKILTHYANCFFAVKVEEEALVQVHVKKERKVE